MDVTKDEIRTYTAGLVLVLVGAALGHRAVQADLLPVAGAVLLARQRGLLDITDNAQIANLVTVGDGATISSV